MSLTAEQLNARHTGLGSSDAAVVLGLSPWKTPYELWLEKTAPEPPPQVENDAMYWGTVLEPIVASEYSRQTGKSVRRRPMDRSRKFPFMTANLDRVVTGEPVIVECKTTGRSSGWGEPGTDEIPPQYLAQCHHQLAVCDHYIRVDVPVLFLSDRRFAVYRVDRDNEVIKRLESAEQEFWDMVEMGVAPPATTLTDLSVLYSQDAGTVVTGDQHVLRACKALAAAKAEASSLSAKAKLLEYEIKQYMGDHAQLLDESGNTLATWKTATSRVVDTKAIPAEVADQYRVERTSRRFLLKTKAE